MNPARTWLVQLDIVRRSPESVLNGVDKRLGYRAGRRIVSLEGQVGNRPEVVGPWVPDAAVLDPPST